MRTVELDRFAPLRRLHYTYLYYRWVSPRFRLGEIGHELRALRGFVEDWAAYTGMDGSEPLSLLNMQPCLQDATELTDVNHHYFYQDVWAFKHILSTGTKQHVDVGSRVDFVGFLASQIAVTFVDIRPPSINLPRLTAMRASLLELPFETGSVGSLSCLHVAEHVGLGRYGDPLDPHGTRKGARELARVLAPGGQLYFSLPVGRPRVCFNAHRVHDPRQILDDFDDLRLVEFSGVDDSGRFIERIDPVALAQSTFACGLFHFAKP